MEGWSFLTDYPQLREAETGRSGRLPGTPVQRLATVERGGGYAPLSPRHRSSNIRDTAIGPADDNS
jgi:hypothetical protein